MSGATIVEEEALALVNEIEGTDFSALGTLVHRNVLLAAIEAKRTLQATLDEREKADAKFRQDVSDAAAEAVRRLDLRHTKPHHIEAILSPFIQTPTDPLYEALKAVVELGRYDTAEQTQLLRHELDARGLAIVSKEKS